MDNKIGKRIHDLRTASGMTLEELAKRLGVQASAVHKYETGLIVNLKRKTIADLADIFDVSPAYLMGWEDAIETVDVGQLLRFPVAAAIRAGFDGLAIEKSDEAITVPRYLLHGLPPDKVIVTRVSGNSMYPRLLDGDAIIVHRQSSVDSGDVAVVVYNGEDATVKIVRYENGCDWMDLVPANPEYMTRRIQGADLQECHVVGKVIGLIRDRI